MRILGMTTLALLLFVSSAVAQDGLGFQGAGVRAGFRIDPDQFLVGGQLDFGDIVRNLRLMPNASIGFGDHMTLISIDPEVHYCFRDNPIASGTWFYAGGGIDFVYSNFDIPNQNELEDLGIEVDDTDTSVGVSLTGGLSYQLSTSQSLMGELRIVLEDESFFEIVGAWNFGR